MFNGFPGKGAQGREYKDQLGRRRARVTPAQVAGALLHSQCVFANHFHLDLRSGLPPKVDPKAGP